MSNFKRCDVILDCHGTEFHAPLPPSAAHKLPIYHYKVFCMGRSKGKSVLYSSKCMENKVQLCMLYGKYSTVMQIIVVVIGVKFQMLIAVTNWFEMKSLSVKNT